MPLFTYKIKDQSGSIIEDTIQAANREEAANFLKASNTQILSVQPVSKGVPLSFHRGIPVAEKAAFCRFMATMLRSGMSINKAIDIVAKESANPKMKRILTDIAFQTQKGKSLSVSMSNYSDDFDTIFLTMIKAGEQSGTLEQSFNYLSEQLSASHELSEKIKGSMMYPAIILVAMVGNGLVMVLFVLPKLSEAFLKLEVPLPIYTKLMLQFGQFVGKNVLVAVIGALILGGIVVWTVLYKRTRNIIMGLFSKVPAIKHVRDHIDLARFSRTLSTLLKSGVPIVEALDVSAQSVSQPKIKEQASKFGESVEKGQSLSDTLVLKRNIFPSLMIQTIKAGEESGSLEQVLEEMAEFYEKEVDFSLKRFTSLLEPVLMLFIGVVVGGMVIMMIAPIYSIIGGLQQQISPGK